MADVQAGHQSLLPHSTVTTPRLKSRSRCPRGHRFLYLGLRCNCVLAEVLASTRSFVSCGLAGQGSGRLRKGQDPCATAESEDLCLRLLWGEPVRGFASHARSVEGLTHQSLKF